MRVRVERERGAVDRERQVASELRHPARDVGLLLCGVDRLVAVRVDQLALLEGRDLRHVDDVVDADRTSLDTERGVPVDGEVAEWVRSRDGSEQRHGEGEGRRLHSFPPRTIRAGASSAARRARAMGAWRRSKYGFRPSARRR